MFKSITRVFVLSGMVSLATAFGTVEGGQGQLLAAETGEQPVKIAVQANSDFGIDMYQQLSKENKDKNLFFSPYSLSSALAMTAEGAVGETAEEMGKVLGYPQAARRKGADAQQLPWQTSLLHTGFGSLAERFNAMQDDPKMTEIQTKLKALRQKLALQKKETQAAAEKRDRPGHKKSISVEEGLVKQINELASKINQYEISIANALWGEKTYPFKQPFLDTINKYYKTGAVFPADFINNFEAERLRINHWAEEQTKEKIKDLLPPASLNGLTRLVLTNAIYFKGDWKTPFKETDTSKKPFTLANGEKVQVPMMQAYRMEGTSYAAFNGDGSFFESPINIPRGRNEAELYPDKKGFAMLELPYKGDELSMVMIAPNQADNLPAVEAMMTGMNLTAWIGKLQKRVTQVDMPKFKMTETYNKMGETLKTMGMERAFTDPRDSLKGAQFDGISVLTDPDNKLYISKVIHKAFVEVNEKGTEAAAATAVVMRVQVLGRANEVYPFIPHFQADRPFVFLIRDKVSGTILFLGRVTQPSAN